MSLFVAFRSFNYHKTFWYVMLCCCFRQNWLLILLPFYLEIKNVLNLKLALLDYWYDFPFNFWPSRIFWIWRNEKVFIEAALCFFIFQNSKCHTDVKNVWIHLKLCHSTIDMQWIANKWKVKIRHKVTMVNRDHIHLKEQLSRGPLVTLVGDSKEQSCSYGVFQNVWNVNKQYLSLIWA